MTTQNTLEVIAAATALTIHVREAKADDGQLSWWETAAILMRQRKAVRVAWDGIDTVPAELLDLSDDELPAVTDGVRGLFAAWDMSHRTQDISEEAVRAAVSLARSIRHVLSLPPTAEPA